MWQNSGKFIQIFSQNVSFPGVSGTNFWKTHPHEFIEFYTISPISYKTFDIISVWKMCPKRRTRSERTRTDKVSCRRAHLRGTEQAEIPKELFSKTFFWHFHVYFHSFSRIYQKLIFFVRKSNFEKIKSLEIVARRNDVSDS